MVLGEQDRQAKLRKVAEALGYDSVFALLNVHTTRELVPGICTRFGCDCITNVPRDATQVCCCNCRHPSVESILRLAQVL